MGTAATREGIGRWLGSRLDHWDRGWRGRLAHYLDERFNLRYLADRLQHEAAALHDYIGEIERLPGGDDWRVSIICRIYGVKPRYVRAFIRSVRRQSCGNWQLCICLDGEPNARLQRLARRLHDSDPERYPLVVHVRNQGICAATRSAVDLATGGVVAFADPDDRLHPDAVAALVKAFSTDPDVDIAYTNSDILTPWGYRIDPIYKPAWSPELLLGCNYINLVVAFRRELLNRCEGLWSREVQGVEDWDTLLRTTPLARRIHHIPVVLYHWRAHATSTATNAKSWTHAVKTHVQDAHLARLDDRLRWAEQAEAGPRVLRFRAQSAPRLQLVEIREPGAPEEPGAKRWLADGDYPGEVRLDAVQVAGSLKVSAEALDERIGALGDEDGLLCFFLGGAGEQAGLDGPVDAQAAFSVLPGVACAWPFYDEWRGVYTVFDDFLGPRLRPLGFFSNWTGNVLTGPLHGLMMERGVWQRLGGFQACVDEAVPEPLPLDALGALFGLKSLQQGIRNVAVRDVRSRYRAPVLELGPFVPEVDPYL